MGKTWYRCKECNKNTDKIDSNNFFCNICDEVKTREQVEAGRTVKPGRSGTPITQPMTMTPLMDPLRVLNDYRVKDIGGYKYERDS